MGITARGAWISVRRHFRALGVDVQNEDVTVAGLGDMSGDVFGNGMLLSRHIRLVAAFDHRHVFLDPDPDPARGYAERAAAVPPAAFVLGRLRPRGDLGRWRGPPPLGQVGPALRRDPPGPRRRTRSLPPDEFIRAILRAPVDLLWNGGIGTYVKASAETHADVGDKRSDSVRVDAGGLRCRVVGEGGNLGFTQRGRVEFALRGGRINTDAIDNAAGVNCSDHEVNIKVLLDRVSATATSPPSSATPSSPR